MLVCAYRIKLTVLFFCLNIVLLTNKSHASSENITCSQQNNIMFKRHDIFNLDDDKTIFLHHWANFLHVKTKEKTLINESAFFLSKCAVNADDLAELERHLRSKKYIRDASVGRSANNIVQIETWDNWSLMPTADFGRKGGKNKFAIGIKDRNLLGLGIDAEIEYFTNNQRTGYKFDTQFPLFMQHNISGSIRLTDTDDGRSTSVFLEKKFVSFNTKNAFKLGFHNFEQQDTQFRYGVEDNIYLHKQINNFVHWGRLLHDSSQSTIRFNIGYIQEEHRFSQIVSISDHVTNQLPHDRTFNYPFVGMEYVEKDFRKLTNVNLINHIEDFNLGIHLKGSIGSEFSDKTSSANLMWQSTLTKGFIFFAHNFLLINAKFSGEIYKSGNATNRFFAQLTTEYVHRIDDKWSAYLKNATILTENQFLDSPVVMGGESGVRGYPLQYQHGNRSTQFTAEIRYYPQINIYKLFELGGVVFVDSGKTFGSTRTKNTDSSWLNSVGLGARLYSTHSSEAQVIHIDIAAPLSSDPSVNNIEFRITTKHSF